MFQHDRYLEFSLTGVQFLNNLLNCDHIMLMTIPIYSCIDVHAHLETISEFSMH